MSHEEDLTQEKIGQSLLEQYSQATTDITNLQHLSYSLMETENPPPGVLPTILRSIVRAEKDASYLRHAYEHEGRR